MAQLLQTAQEKYKQAKAAAEVKKAADEAFEKAKEAAAPLEAEIKKLNDKIKQLEKTIPEIEKKLLEAEQGKNKEKIKKEGETLLSIRGEKIIAEHDLTRAILSAAEPSTQKRKAEEDADEANKKKR